MLELNKIYNMDCMEGLKQLPDNSINCCVTSPPYWGLRDYGVDGQIGLEVTPAEYVGRMVEVFKEVKRVLRADGTLWLNLGDSYAGYWGDKKAREENRPSMADTNGWTNGFNMNARPDFHNAFDEMKIKPKDLVGIPWMVAFALRADGWYLRQDIIWHKPNPMPESVKDRCTKAHEYIFLLSKSQHYYYDYEAIKEPCTTNENRPFGAVREREYGYNSKHLKARGYKVKQGSTEYPLQHKGKDIESNSTRNKRSVWTVTTKPFKEAHFATFPPDLIKPCILAGCPKNGIVLDPFMGSGTTGMVAAMYQRNFIGFELNPEYCKMAEKRIEPYLMQQTIFELLKGG